MKSINTINSDILLSNCKNNKWICFFLLFVIMDSILLLFLGRAYSKFELIQHIYLHDLVNFITVLVALPILFDRNNRIISIEILSLLALFYLVISLWNNNVFQDTQALYITIRQFMLFGYMITSYIIIKKIASNRVFLEYLFHFIIYFAKASLVVQFIYVVFQLVIKNNNPIFLKYYYSPAAILGLIIFSSYVLFFYKGWKKWIVFLFSFFLSLTMGHDAAFLSHLVVLFIWILVTSRKSVKILISISFIGLLIMLYIKMPAFQDVNSQWRFNYWGYTLKQITEDNYFLKGEGFGNTYIDEEQRQQLNEIMKRNGFNLTFLKEEQYLTPPHNSFLTIMYHLGGISILLFIYPIIHLMWKKENLLDSKKAFLFTAFIGLSAWSFFNVILELPHSSTIYWIVFFTLIFYCNIAERKPAFE